MVSLKNISKTKNWKVKIHTMTAYEMERFFVEFIGKLANIFPGHHFLDWVQGTLESAPNHAHNEQTCIFENENTNQWSKLWRMEGILSW